MIKVAPSILSADFGHLANEALRLQEAGCDAIHIDVMDGLFVPNLTLGPKAVAAIRRSCSAMLDVHLMIYNPFEFIERFAESGANLISFHLEATEDVGDILRYIKKCNLQAGLAINPNTSASLLMPYLEMCDLVLCMSVTPGFSGQEFMPEALENIKMLKQAKDLRKLSFDIQVDGGINERTASLCVKAGANFLVAGEYLFKQPDMAAAIGSLKKIS